VAQVSQLFTELLLVHFAALILSERLAKNARGNLEDGKEGNKLGERNRAIAVKVDYTLNLIVVLFKILF